MNLVPQSLFSKLAAALRGFRREQRAAAAVEFALILPLLLVLYFGCVHYTQALTADRKATLLARTVSDLVAQRTALTAADVDAIFDAAQAVLYPFNPANATIIVSQLKTDNNSKTTVDCSRARNTSARAKGDIFTISNPTPNTTRIYAEVTYQYNPIVGVMTWPININQITLRSNVFWWPRNGTSVNWTC